MRVVDNELELLRMCTARASECDEGRENEVDVCSDENCTKEPPVRYVC